MSEASALATIEAVVRDSYGRLVAYLSARSGDLAGAEDALSDALVAALERWPAEGVPRKPEAWLLHVARNRRIDAARRRQVRQDYAPMVHLHHLTTAAHERALEPGAFPDERLSLLFVCAHPAIDPAARTPLMLQTVLGIDAARIAAAFLTSPVAMTQRLVRAKTKIRQAAIPFHVPEREEWGERVDFVLEAIYSAYTTGWDNPGEPGAIRRALAAEAIQLARTLVQLMPDEPEVRGLLALLLHCEARSGARLSDTGEFVPLDRQDPARWSQPAMAEAEAHLRAAAQARRLGRYQLEAAIQSIHAHRAVTGTIDWPEIALCYEALVKLAPRIGLLVARAVALGEASGPAHGWAALDALPADRVSTYQPYWAARGHLLLRLRRSQEAAAAFARAAGLTEDPVLRAHLLRREEDAHHGSDGS